MSSLKNRAWLLLAASITLQLVLVRSARVLKHDYIPHGRSGLLFKRDGEAPHESLLSMPYADWYDNASPASKPFVVFGLLCVLAFLFSFIGITASDFFCPNLSTIASYLGLNESTAGVTFLAFGNGSPDVFSTFAALRGGTFSLAIGELIGAATFIVSIVVGTIALIKPFHVPKNAFLRDVLFFTAAVITLVVVLHDGHLSFYESGAMVLLYILYVTVVILGNWWNRRRKQKETMKAMGWKQASPNQSRPSAGARIPSIHLPDPVIERDVETGSRASSHLSSPASRTASPILSPHRIRHRRGISSHLIPTHDRPEIDTPRANFSLLGAIEFRDVVNSLRKESESRGNSPVRTPIDEEGEDYFGAAVSNMYGHRRSSSVGVGHGHSRREATRGRQRSASHIGPMRSPSGDLSPIPVSPPADSDETPTQSPSIPNPWTDQLGRPPSAVHTPTIPSPNKPTRPRIDIPRKQSGPRIPSISIIDPSGLPGAPPTATEPSATTPAPMRNESRFKVRRRIRMVLRVLFPSLQSFRHKSYLGMVLAITAVPQILALTVTLPVVDDGPIDEGAVALPMSDGEGLEEDGVNGDNESDHGDGARDHYLNPNIGEELHHLVDGGFSPLHSPLGRIHHSALRRMASQISSAHPSEEDGDEDDEEDMADKELLEELRSEEMLEFHRGLTAAQCVLGPALCVLIIFRETDYFKWILLGAVLGGIIAAGAVLVLAQDGSSRTWRLVRCFAGFICSMVWIAAIADEVVSVLQAIGEILGLSDAIIGLTIFAVGNSLADLVANVTVAHFAPAMAYAACFGGPMLNLLLGVGGSGTYHMISQPHKARVTLHFSPTLWVSAGGLVVILLSTAVIVPLNGYLIDRRWAVCLIVAYIVLMTINVIVEVKTGRN